MTRGNENGWRWGEGGVGVGGLTGKRGGLSIQYFLKKYTSTLSSGYKRFLFFDVYFFQAGARTRAGVFLTAKE